MSELASLIGKTVWDIDWDKKDGTDNLHSITFDDGTVLKLYASDYDNIVMPTIEMEE